MRNLETYLYDAGGNLGLYQPEAHYSDIAHAVLFLFNNETLLHQDGNEGKQVVNEGIRAILKLGLGFVDNYSQNGDSAAYRVTGCYEDQGHRIGPTGVGENRWTLEKAVDIQGIRFSILEQTPHGALDFTIQIDETEHLVLTGGSADKRMLIDTTLPELDLSKLEEKERVTLGALLAAFYYKGIYGIQDEMPTQDTV